MFVFFLDVGSVGWEKIQEFYLPHPRTGNKSMFLVDCSKENKTKNMTYEVLTMQQDTRSWFVDDSILSDGNLYVCTPVDPLFLILPILAKSAKARPISDHFQESSLPRVVSDLFNSCLSHKTFENIAEKRGFDDIIAFVYSEDKALSWLTKKVEKVAEFLMKKGISHAETSVSSNFIKDSISSISKEDSVRYACDIVGEYLEETLKRKLQEKLGVPVVQEKSGLKRKSEKNLDDENSNVKKSKTSGDDPAVPLEDYGSSASTPTNKNTKATAREKVFQKAAQGSHSLFKFFAAKGK